MKNEKMTSALVEVIIGLGDIKEPSEDNEQ